MSPKAKTHPATEGSLVSDSELPVIAKKRASTATKRTSKTTTAKKMTTKKATTTKATPSTGRGRKKAEVLPPEIPPTPWKPGKGVPLVIVESPAKAKTIKKLLGEDLLVLASKGHIRDLPERTLGVDLKESFKPQYQVMSDKIDTVEDLRKAAQKASKVYLAPDPDREGEAIAWHIAYLLGLPEQEANRIEFHEITRSAIQHALDTPRPINLPKVNAQQARRVLDRLVGYKLSPLLWQKVTKGLSAGRVQSVAVRLLCDREAEIEAFVIEEYWSIHGVFSAQSPQSASASTKEVSFEADLVKLKGKKPHIPTGEVADALLDAFEHAVKQQAPEVVSRQVKEVQKSPPPPYITSTLQRDASNRLGYPVKKTMQVAQKLYEGVDIGHTVTGLITYMRTDSTRVADEAQKATLEWVSSHYGKEYLPPKPRHFAQKKGNVQDAHEAIRPTDVSRTPEMMRPHLNDEQWRLYTLIWQRFVASQMAVAKLLRTSLELLIQAEDALFRASHQAIAFPGYLKVYQRSKANTQQGQDADEALSHEEKPSSQSHEDDDDRLSDMPLPELAKGHPCPMRSITSKQHFTEPPPRYNEASLVKVMEELGIGRPSTYAPTIATIQDRGYANKEGKTLIPTELGKTVNKLLVAHFPTIVDTHFTAQMEGHLDAVEEAHQPWQELIRSFYEPFELTLKKASAEVEKVQVFIEGENCDLCGSPMVLKTSRFGKKFLGCSAYPTCSSIRPLTKDQKAAPPDRPTEERCEKCSGPMVIRYGPYGDYFACLDTACGHKQKMVVKTGVKCPSCDAGELVQKKSRYGKIFYSCNQYPTCTYAVWQKPIEKTCPQCQHPVMVEKVLKKGTFHACPQKECGHQELVEALT
ncbi:MAG: type I DNA topoisomerase [Vampirovibrionales bacterium]